MLRGSLVVDKLIDGLEPDTITTIFGPSGGGKTTICLEYSSEVLKRGKKVFYVDTEGGFSPERLKQINPEVDLSKVLVFSPTSFEKQKKTIDRINEEISNYGQDVGLIILDSLVMLYRLNVDRTPKRVNKELADQLNLLAQISREFEIPILVTNQEYKVFDTGEMRMVGGNLVEYCSKTILQVYKENSYREIKLKKHKYIKEGEKVKFEIENKGLKELNYLS